MTVRDVVVVGGGAAGVLVAAHVAAAAQRTTRVVVVDDGPGRIGAGIAYRTTDARHLLNVRASGLSAWSDRPAHFVSWLGALGVPATGAEFFPRELFGRYLAAVAYDAGNGRHAHVEYRRCRAEEIRRDAAHWWVRLSDGRVLATRAVVLAPGVSAPAVDWAPPGVTAAPRFIADPWAPGALAGIGPGDPVLIVGAGLTAVDVALSLAPRAGRLSMVSRRGRLPATHSRAPRAALPLDPARLPATLAATRWLVGDLMAAARATGGDWRPGFDALRPYAARIWSSWPGADQAEFVRSYARRWEVLRHRMAPAVAARIAELRAAGQLSVTAGHAAAEARHALAAGAWVVAATGTDAHPRRDRLLADLLDQGLASVGPLGLGLSTDRGQLRDPAGRPVPGLYTLGATRRGELWESTAIGEIRLQAAELGDRLTGSHREPSGRDRTGAAGRRPAVAGEWR